MKIIKNILQFSTALSRKSNPMVFLQPVQPWTFSYFSNEFRESFNLLAKSLPLPNLSAINLHNLTELLKNKIE